MGTTTTSHLTLLVTSFIMILTAVLTLSTSQFQFQFQSMMMMVSQLISHPLHPCSPPSLLVSHPLHPCSPPSLLDLQLSSLLDLQPSSLLDFLHLHPSSLLSPPLTEVPPVMQVL